MERNPTTNPNSTKSRSREGDLHYHSPIYEEVRDGERFRIIWESLKRHRHRTRVGQTLYMIFAGMGVRASAELATRNEPDFLTRYLVMQRMIANWRATRRRLEQEGA